MTNENSGQLPIQGQTKAKTKANIKLPLTGSAGSPRLTLNEDDTSFSRVNWLSLSESSSSWIQNIIDFPPSIKINEHVEESFISFRSRPRQFLVSHFILNLPISQLKLNLKQSTLICGLKSRPEVVRTVDTDVVLESEGVAETDSMC